MEPSSEEPRVFEEIRQEVYKNALPEPDSSDSWDSGGSDTDFRD